MGSCMLTGYCAFTSLAQRHGGAALPRTTLISTACVAFLAPAQKPCRTWVVLGVASPVEQYDVGSEQPGAMCGVAFGTTSRVVELKGVLYRPMAKQQSVGSES